jgi:hypothetical protein
MVVGPRDDLTPFAQAVRLQMDCIVCSVIAVNGRWFADCGATRHGPYVSADIATRVAIGEARVLHRRGRSVKVSIQDENGKVCAEHSFCADLKKARG